MMYERVILKLLGGGLVIFGLFILFSTVPMPTGSFGGVGFSSAGAAEAAADDTIRRTFDVSPGGILDLTTDRGSITVAAGDGSEVRVVIRRQAETSERARRFTAEFDQEGDVVRVTGRTEESGGFFGRNRAPDVSFEIHVPREFDLQLDTRGGSIRIGDHHGDVDVRTAGGSITAGDVAGSIVARTAGGSINVAAVEGPAELRTAGGSVTLSDLQGDATVETAGGSISIGSVRGSIAARTSGGSISAGAIHELTGDSSLQTAGGGLRVNLAPEADLVLDASTTVGRISSNLGLPIEEGWTSAEMEGAVGEGGPTLRLRTNAGSIQVDRG